MAAPVGSIPTRSRHGGVAVKRAYVVVNPVAGRGRGRRLAQPIGEAFRARGWDVEVRATTRAGEERVLAAAAARDGWPLVVVAGGDGTVHEVANGLLREAPHTTLGVLGAGTGNDFAGLVGTAGSVEQGVRALERGQDRSFDVGQVEGEYFTNGFGVGFGPAVLQRMEQLPRLRGSVLYLGAAMRTFVGFRPETVELDADAHREVGPLMLAEVAIGRTAGGGYRFTPHADPEDGLFDVCVIRRVSLLQFLRYLPRVAAGTHATLPPVTIVQARAVRIATPGRALVAHLDGEVRTYGGDTLDVRLLPRALKVRCAA